MSQEQPPWPDNTIKVLREPESITDVSYQFTNSVTKKRSKVFVHPKKCPKQYGM